MKILGFLAKAGKLTTGDEFKVLFFICNTLSLNNTTEIEIDRVTISKLCGWWNEDKATYSLKKISNLTGSLVEKGLLVKRLTFCKETLQRKTFYTIPTLEVEKVMQKNIPSNSMYKPVKELNKHVYPVIGINNDFEELDFLK